MVLLSIDKRIVRMAYILTYFLLFFSVLTKLFCIPYISTKFYILGISEYCRIFGTIELISVIAFIFPRTMGLGLMMLCAYFGGAIATDIHSPEYLYQPLIVLTLVFMTALFKKPAIFHESFKIEWSDRVRLTLDKISRS